MSETFGLLFWPNMFPFTGLAKNKLAVQTILVSGATWKLTMILAPGIIPVDPMNSPLVLEP